MRELQSELSRHETSIMVDFHHIKHCVRCYAHIINICCSHIISSATSVSKQYLSELDIPIDSNHVFCDDSVDDSDDESDGDGGMGPVSELMKLDDSFDTDDPKLKKMVCRYQT